MTAPLRYAPIDQQLDALADLLATLPIEFDGVRLDGSIVQTLHDAALIIRAHHSDCPRLTGIGTTTRPTSRRAAIRRHYG